MVRESRYAECLLKLGFKKVPIQSSPEERYPLVFNFLRTLPRRERRRVQRKVYKLLEQPSFTISSNEGGTNTFVTDEVGQDWVASGSIDLFHLGFIDNNEWLKRLGRSVDIKSVN